MAGWVRGLVVMALLLAGFALKGLLTVPPPAPTHAAASDFDPGRAVARLQRILGDQRPHPVDSDADDEVRNRLVAELQALGLRPRVQDTVDCSAMPNSRAVSCSRVRNVIATTPGTARGPHLLLNAHYDSTPAGPGAADDGLGVATLLEVAAILQHAAPPRPVTFLFNEGEEFGLNGAHAFLRDPEAREVNSLINVEARGVSGPATMFETSDPNAAALAIYAAGARRPFANSISTDFARLIPNTTDVVFFKPRGWTILNFAIIGNETRYHSPGDTVAALDRRSLAHMGSEVLGATRAMASERDPGRVAAGRAVFTDLAGQVLLRMPLAVAAGLLAILLIGGLILAWRRGALGKPLLVAAATVSGGIAVASLVGFLLQLLRPGDFWRAYPLIAYLAVYAVLLLAMTAIYRRLADGDGRTRVRVAAWFLIIALGCALSLALPGAAIFFLIAPAFGLAGVAVEQRSPQLAKGLLIVACAVQFLMFAKLLALIEMLLVDGPLWAVLPLAALAILPILGELEARDLRPAGLSMLFAALALCVAALIVPRSSHERPLGFSIDYFRDLDEKTAKWAVATNRAPLPPDFPGRWERGVLASNARPRWISSAAQIETPVAQARVIASEQSGAGRRVGLVISAGGGDLVSIRFAENARVVAMGLPDQPIAIPTRGEPDKASLRCIGRSCEGMQIELVIADRQPVTAELFSTRFTLPPQGRPLVRARPANAQPQYTPDQTVTRSILRL